MTYCKTLITKPVLKVNKIVQAQNIAEGAHTLTLTSLRFLIVQHEQVLMPEFYLGY